MSPGPQRAPPPKAEAQSLLPAGRHVPHLLPARPPTLPGSAAGSHGNRPQTARESPPRAPRRVSQQPPTRSQEPGPWAEVRSTEKRKPRVQPEENASVPAKGSLPAPRDTGLCPEGRHPADPAHPPGVQPATLYI